LGDIPEGSTLSVGYFDDEEIISSTRNKLEEMLADISKNDTPPNGILMFSCIGRFLTLGFEPDREIEEVRACLDKTRIPYTLIYSGGEICPLTSHDASGKPATRFHNSTFCMLVI
jgi:hypothetical protein